MSLGRTPKEKATQRLFAVSIVSLLAAYVLSHFHEYETAMAILCGVATMSGLSGFLISTAHPRD